MLLLADDPYEVDDRMRARGPSANEREHITEKPFSAIVPSESVLRDYLRPKEIDLPSYGPSAVRMFWITFFVVNVLSVFIAGISGTEAIAAVIFILLFMPGFQLGSAALVAFILGLSFRPDKSYQLRKLAMIVLGAVVGTIAGILAMVGLFFAFNPTEIDIQAAGWSLVGSVVAGVALAGLLALSRPSGK